MKPDQQQLAQDLYLNTDKTQQEIADILNVNRRTVYLWIKTGRWEEMKLAVKQAPALILQDIYNHIEAINGKIRRRGPNDRVPVMQEVEMLRKLLNMTTAIQKKNSGSYAEVFTELIIFISRSDDALAMRVRDFTSRYMRGTFGEKSFYTENNIRVNEVVDNLKKEEAQAAVAEQPIPEPVIVSNAEPTVIVHVPVISENPAEGHQQPCKSSDSENPDSDNNATSCDKNAIFSSTSEEQEISPKKPADTASGTKPLFEEQPQKYPIGSFSQNGIFHEIQTTQNENPQPPS